MKIFRASRSNIITLEHHLQTLKLVKRYEIHRKLHVGCGGDSSVQHRALALFFLLYDSLQRTSQLRKGVAVVDRTPAKAILDSGISTVFKKKICRPG